MNQGKNASLNSTDALLQENQGLTFGSTEFLFSVGIADTYGNQISNEQNDIFSVVFYFCDQIDLKTICDFIPSVPCNNIDQTIDNVTQRNTYCINPEGVFKNEQLFYYWSINKFL